MSLKELFERFVEDSPVAVMSRVIFENVFSPEVIDRSFVDSAVRQRSSELLFSSVVDLMTLVVFKQRSSVNDAYLSKQKQFRVSIVSVYNKLNGTEMAVCRELVRHSGVCLEPIIDAFQAKRQRKRVLDGYETRIIDGNHLTSTDHRLKVLRKTRRGPLPGQALAILDPDQMLFVDLFPHEDAHAQERRIIPQVLPSIKKRQLWIADRNFCTTAFLFGIADKKASFVIRQHSSTLTWDKETKLKKVGCCPTGTIYEQTLFLTNDGEETLEVRRIVVKLKEPTRDGDTEIQILTNLPTRVADARKVCDLYSGRWTIENAFQEMEQSLRSEIDTLGYPGAALLGFAIAAIAYNTLSVVKWAIECEHGETIKREEISGYYFACEISAVHGGMMIALPPNEWTKRFANLTPIELAKKLCEMARYANPLRYRKNKRGPKKPKPKGMSGSANHHVSTARLIAAKKMTA